MSSTYSTESGVWQALCVESASWVSVQLEVEPLRVMLQLDSDAYERECIRSLFCLDEQANASDPVSTASISCFRLALILDSCLMCCQFEVEFGSGSESSPNDLRQYGWVIICPPLVPLCFLPEVEVLCVDLVAPSVISTDYYLGPGCGGFHAFVCGNNTYSKEKALQSCVGDASEVAELLASYGYDVVIVRNGDLPTTKAAFAWFLKWLQPGHTAVVYFSGHGVQVDGVNLLLPVDGVGTDPSTW